MLSHTKLDNILMRFETLSAKMAEGVDPVTYVDLSREYAELDPVVQKIRALKSALGDLKEVEHLLTERDPEMIALAEAEKPALEEKIESLTQSLKIALLPKDAADDKSVILEIRAGTGGDEAGLFAGDLFRMYQRYATLKGWGVEIVEANEAALGGYKEVIAAINGRGAYARLKFESGVHRVQRVPDTEASGRIHTSAATVAVLPEAEEVDIQIDEKDLKVDVFRAQGAGGQHVNKTESAVRITHIPTGIAIVVQDERSQHRNRAQAMKVLRAQLYDKERQQKDAARAAERKGQVGSGDRSERIRTYNYPQGRVTDHRIGLTLYKLPAILEGVSLDEMIEALMTQHQADLLAAEE